MKILNNIVLGLLISTATFAQNPYATRSFDVAGIKVIFKPTQKKIVNVRVYYRGGTANYAASKAGIEHFALAGAAECGTKNFSANTLKDTCDKYDISLSGSGNFDFGFVQLNCISKYFDKGWYLFADAVTDPAYQSHEVQLLRGKIMLANKTLASNPIILASKQLMLNTLKGTQYGFDPCGTDETLKDINQAELKNYYYNTLLNKERMFIVVVGNITKEELVQKIMFSFANLPSRPYNKPDMDEPDFNDNKLIKTQQALPVNYIAAMGNSPLVKSADFVPFKLGVAAFGATLYNDLVVNGHLADNTGTNCMTTLVPYVNIVLMSNKPQAAVSGAINTLRNFQERGVNEDWLTRIKNNMVINNFISQQNVAAVTDRLGEAEVFASWQYADDFPQLVFMTTVQQVNAVMKKYITGLTWSYLGNLNAIDGYNIPPLK
ncbi:pitrilysin family protein [Mucilaginibacter panaciglaebae]|uniref:Peptidase M16 C-terminal domain-containing protein n=1 Tax=Mucilaginibacter panaciglaebae TaxID=502331 RepID=A0ABP7WTM1_9SPHI